MTLRTKNQQQYRRLEEFSTLLKESAGFASGQSLAERAGISRSAVWKQVRQLRQCGYVIESLHGMGYRLVENTTQPVPWELYKVLKTSFIGKGVIIYRDRVDSTQRIAIALAEKCEEIGTHGAVIIAEQQSSGRGRLKRNWLSPRGGIWISVLLKPSSSSSFLPGPNPPHSSIPTAASTLMPFVAALAVCDAIRQVTGLPAMLKWPNDVMVKGRKAAGILLDLSAEAETINYAIIGIGVNVNIDASKLRIDRDGKPAITSLREELGHEVNRLELTRVLLENLEKFYEMLECGMLEKIISEWRLRTDMFGKSVRVVQQEGKNTVYGIAVDIDHDGSLVLKTASGNVNVTFGDIYVSY
jgi:BirA family biotin operon repressor/biotin-[acetyl-CoA-carboxylase] ligase